MFSIIVSLLVIFLCLLGISEIIYFIASLIFNPTVKPTKFSIIYLNNKCAEQQILSELFNIRWFGNKFSQKLIFITDDLSLDEAHRLEQEYTSSLTVFRSGVFNGRE